MDNLNPKQIKITIRWTDLLLTLGACAGNLSIELLDIPPTTTIKSKVLLTARVRVERYSHGYKNAVYFNGLTHSEFDKYIYPTVTRMMKSYHKGMLLSKLDYEWIDHWKNS